MNVYVCMYIDVRLSVCVRERERKRERECVCVRETKKISQKIWEKEKKEKKLSK